MIGKERIMSKQITFDDVVPSEIAEKVRTFMNDQYYKARDGGDLPTIKNRHEAYGILAECVTALMGATTTVKKALADALGSISASADAFNEAVDTCYSGCLASAQMATNCAISAMNIAMQYANAGAPLDDIPLMQTADEEELPEVE